jgi:DNA-binding MarR family transcriptional regulator
MTAKGTLGQPQTLPDLLLYRLSSLFRTGGAPMVRLCEGRYNITRREWRTLGAVVEQPGLSPSELAERVFLDRARASRSIGPLVDKGLVVRLTRPGDGRHATLMPTEKGIALYRQLLPEVIHHNKALLAALTPAETEMLDAMLGRLMTQALALSTSADQFPKTQRGGRSPR